MIEFDEHCSSSVIPMVAIYHEDAATEEDVQAAIQTFGIGESNNVLIISKQLYNNVFYGGSLA